MAGFIYVASPYSHNDPAVMTIRFYDVMAYTAWLLKAERWAYSPIVHHHEMARRHNLPNEFDYWMRLDFAMLNAASELHVLMLPGWLDSKGVRAEVREWNNRRPITYTELPTHI